MGIHHPAELEGQLSINELLDQPIGTEPIQLALPIHFSRDVLAGLVSKDPR